MTTTITSSLYRSPSKGLEVHVRDEIPERHPITMDVIGVKAPRLRAEFGIYGPQQSYYDQLSGRMETIEPIIGGFFDLDVTAEHKGWSDDDKEIVRRRLDAECVKRPDTIQRLDYTVEDAPLPWPTYVGLSEEEALDLAEKLGLAASALRYERENENRPDLVEALTALAPEAEQPQRIVRELPPDSGHVTIAATPASVLQANERATIRDSASRPVL